MKENKRAKQIKDKRISIIEKAYKVREIQREINLEMEELLGDLYITSDEFEIYEGYRVKMDKITSYKTDKIIIEFNDYIKNKESQPKKIKIIEITEELYEAIKKAKKNKFIECFIDDENIGKLLETFTDKELTKSLFFVSREIKTNIKTLDNFIKVIKTGVEN